MVVTLAVEKFLYIFGPKPKKRTELHDWDTRRVASCVIADPTLGNGEALGNLPGVEEMRRVRRMFLNG